MEAEFERQLARIKKIDLEARAEERELELVNEERTRTLSTLVGEAWMTKTFPEKYASVTDPLLAKKFKTKAGHSSIRLEKLLLELDKVDTLGDENLRSQRKEEVRYIQSLLQKADELNSKALRLVQFQESLAEVGKRTLQTTLEPPSSSGGTGGTNGGAAPHGEFPPHSGARRFAEAVPSPDSDSDVSEAEKVAPEKEDKVSDDTAEELAPNDSYEHLQATQEEQDRLARDYYMKHTDRSQHSVRSENEAKRVEVQADSNSNQQGRPNRKGKSTSPHSQRVENDSKSEPLVQVKELPRAYVMLVKDAHVSGAVVSLDAEHKLHISVPGKQVLEYSLGSNINLRGITKEIRGDILQIVLPKTVQRQQPIRTAGYPYMGGTPMIRGGGWNRDDFWSRF